MLSSVKTLALRHSLVARSIAYIAKPAKPGRGLKKDVEEYMVSPNGVRYPGNEDTLRPLKGLLGEEFKLRDSLLLQTLVHKSFAHGKVPYNDKLALLGQHLIRLEAFRHAAAQEVPEAKYADVNGQNFNISPNALDLLASTPVLSKVCEKAGLEPTLFFKHGQAKISPTVKAKTIHAVVGALVFERGTESALRFINSRLLGGDLNVFSIANNLYIEKS